MLHQLLLFLLAHTDSLLPRQNSSKICHNFTW